MNDERRRLTTAALLWAVLTLVYLAFASKDRILHHTPYDHFAILARSWLDGRLDMGGPPPAWTGNNDFALYQGKWYVVFPGFPAVLLLPAVWLAKTPEATRDGLVFLLFAGAGPSLLFLALEKLRDTGRSAHGLRTNAALAALFGVGTVYFFSAEQGTVWFAAHVIGVSLAALYALFSLGAERPLLAGLAIGLGFWTRTPLLFAFPLFVFEAWRVSMAKGTPREAMLGFVRRLAIFALPIALLLALAMVHNQKRFGSPFEFGYRYLTVYWQARIEKWGLFSYHYLARNLSVALTSLPFWNPHPTPNDARLQISVHGIALWLTTPVYLWLLWPKANRGVFRALIVTALFVALPSLFYQNSGQLQFGYRFSNDFAVFLFLALAAAIPRLTLPFWALGALGIAVNAFGAATFEKSGGARYYDRSGQIVQPD